MANFNLYVDSVDLSLWRELCQREGELRHYPKGSYFLRSGETPRHFGFIESGCFKFSVIDSTGAEHITGFAPCHNFAGDFFSAIRNAPALNDLSATVNSTVWVVDANRVRQWMAEHTDFHLHFAEVLFRMAHERYVNLYRQTPKERYLELLTRCPEILQQVSLKDLASYLQITPTHLSRIRKELRSDKKS